MFKFDEELKFDSVKDNPAKDIRDISQQLLMFQEVEQADLHAMNIGLASVPKAQSTVKVKLKSKQIKSVSASLLTPEQTSELPTIGTSELDEGTEDRITSDDSASHQYDQNSVSTSEENHPDLYRGTMIYPATLKELRLYRMPDEPCLFQNEHLIVFFANDVVILFHGNMVRSTNIYGETPGSPQTPRHGTSQKVPRHENYSG
ncbi:hypothetical protein PABG_12518 [Paracoccidioides brasiliensis Pb03]|nr:hypothetical protein PABG_12518 [Paracoccidioides brasiliensis Pb03]